MFLLQVQFSSCGITQKARLALDITAHLENVADANGTKVIKLYHFGMCNSDLKSILEEFTKPDSCTRFLISTIAFGIEINIPGYTGGTENNGRLLVGGRKGRSGWKGSTGKNVCFQSISAKLLRGNQDTGHE
ncbi:hypothetical protein DPMN_139705 [Dreissena polymorpha]|uniref:Uncharacterized protein n=1 Tax=Dreissena polymorpha TaxID=45954 RepID=A0A9D4JGR7_DREPO|nr:hypothetical protein DPMN_139705 [Dreissena polymorpha]